MATHLLDQLLQRLGAVVAILRSPVRSIDGFHESGAGQASKLMAVDVQELRCLCCRNGALNLVGQRFQFHGGNDVKDLGREDLAALERGLVNLERHVDNIRHAYGLPCVVAVNHFVQDTDAEHALLSAKLAERGQARLQVG